MTRREHYQGLARQGADVPELHGPDLPEAARYLMEWFGQLHSTRPGGPSGPAPLRYTEIKAWAELTGRKLSWWEVETIKRLDRLWLETYYD